MSKDNYLTHYYHNSLTARSKTMKVFKRSDWKESFEKSISNFCDANGAEKNKCEVSEEMHDEMLNCMPPIYFSGGFQVSEPYDSRGGFFTYGTFTNCGGRYFYRGNLTKSEAKAL